MNGLNLAIP